MRATSLFELVQMLLDNVFVLVLTLLWKSLCSFPMKIESLILK